MSDELAALVERILTDGTYAGEVTRIGEHDPDRHVAEQCVTLLLPKS